MPTLRDLGLSDTGDLLGAAAGTFPSPVFRTLSTIGQRGEPTAAYIGALGPRSVIGPARGSPGGLPVMAGAAPNLMLTRERIMRELEDNPAIARKFDATTTAEVGTDPDRRRKYQATVIDRAVSRGTSLGEEMTNPAFYPPSTQAATKTSGYQPDPALFEGANPAGYATGNASFDPRTGRWVGFGGGPQTATGGTGRGMELYGIEKFDLPYARAMGYLGAGRTPIGPGGPTGEANTAPLGWESTVSAAPGGVGYVNPARVGQGGTTDPALLQRAPESGFNWGRFLAGLDFTPARAAPAAPAFSFGQPVFRPFQPIGRR